MLPHLTPPCRRPPSEKQPAEHILLAATRDPAALLADGGFGRYGGPALNRFERMSVTVGGVLAQKQQMTEVAPCFVMRGAMVVGAAGGRIACNKFVVEGLGLEELPSLGPQARFALQQHFAAPRDAQIRREREAADRGTAAWPKCGRLGSCGTAGHHGLP